MTSIRVGDLLELATQALHSQGFPEDVASDVAEEFVIAELAGIRTHGLGKLVSLNLGDFEATPDVIERGCVITVDGRGGNGFVLLREVVDLVGKRCPDNGVSVAFVHNFSRYSSLYPYTDRLARQGLVAILTNSAGPAAVTPYGSIDPITGTNPICFSFPTSTERPQTFDFATSELVWGEIRQASLEGRGLPTGPFLDTAGEVTSDPSLVNAVRAFGGVKGWALNLAIEIIAGILSGGRAGLDVETEFDCGAVLIAIDPRAAGADASSFPDQVEALLASVRSSRPEHPDTPVRAPGDRGRSAINIADRAASSLELPETTIEMMKRMAAGEKIAELASNPKFN